MQNPDHTNGDKVEESTPGAGSTATGAETVRSGSPFRPSAGGVGSRPAHTTGGAAAIPGFDPSHDGAKSFDIGVTTSTAFGGLLASYCILPFAAIAAGVFPLGAIMIGGLGTVLAVFALAAQRPLLTTIALVLHLCLGAVGYAQML